MHQDNQPNSERTQWWTDLQSHLGAPFPIEQVNWKPMKTWNPDNWDDKDKRNHTNALAVAYLDARSVADRFDEVLTLGGWQVQHRQEGTQLLTGIALYDPFLNIWLWKWDAGHVNGDNKNGEVTKGTLSDGLKRAAVLWGVGRYLYSLPRMKVPYDPRRRKLVRNPELPAWAQPGGSGRP